MCMIGANVKSKSSLDLGHDTSGYFVSSTETDMSKMRLHSDESVVGIARRLEAQKAVESGRQFVITQKQLGFTYHPGMITLDPLLSTIYFPISALLWDWMHCFLIDGIFAVTVGEMMCDLRPKGVTYARMAEFVSKWHWPGRVKNRGVSGTDVFKASKWQVWYTEKKF